MKYIKLKLLVKDKRKLTNILDEISKALHVQKGQPIKSLKEFVDIDVVYMFDPKSRNINEIKKYA